MWALEDSSLRDNSAEAALCLAACQPASIGLRVEPITGAFARLLAGP